MPRSPKREAIQKRQQALRECLAKLHQDLQRAEAAERQEAKRQHRRALWAIATLYEEAGALDMKLELDPEMLRGAFVHLAGLATASVGHPVVWRHPARGTSGQVVATRPSQIPQTRYYAERINRRSWEAGKRNRRTAQHAGNVVARGQSRKASRESAHG